jgi:hypothetical protein
VNTLALLDIEKRELGSRSALVFRFIEAELAGE